MQVQRKQQQAGETVSSTPELERAGVARGGTRTVPPVQGSVPLPKDRGLRRKLAAIALVFVLLSAAAIGVTAASLSDGANRAPALDRRADDGLSQPGFLEARAIEHPGRVQRALSWLNGLAVGLILPTDVSGRLAQQDPELARMVIAAWGDLRGL